MSNDKSSKVSTKTPVSHPKPVPPSGPTPLSQDEQQKVGGGGDRTGLPKGGW